MPFIKKHPFVILLAILAVLQSCQFGSIGTWQNEKINAGIRTELAGLNQQLFQRIMDKDVNSVKQIMSFELMAQAGDKVDSMLNNMGSGPRTGEFKLIDEYYTQNLVGDVDVTITSNHGNHNDYQVKYHAANREMYVALMVSKNQPVNRMVLAIYGKHDDGWKLNILQTGQYDLFGKTAPECYDEAQRQYKKQNWINSSNYVVYAYGLSAPANGYFTYKNDEQIKAFYAKVIKEANSYYGFPFAIGKVPTHPVIRNVRPDFFVDKANKRIFPVVSYISSIALKDTIALKRENNAVQQIISTIFNGIKDDNDYIAYHVFNQNANGNLSAEPYPFVQKLK